MILEVVGWHAARRIYILAGLAGAFGTIFPAPVESWRSKVFKAWRTEETRFQCHFSISNHLSQQISANLLTFMPCLSIFPYQITQTNRFPYFLPALFHLISSKPTDFRICSCHLPYKTVKHQQVSEQRFDLAGHSPVVLVDHNVPKNQSPYYQPGQSKGRNLNTAPSFLWPHLKWPKHNFTKRSKLVK